MFLLPRSSIVCKQLMRKISEILNNIINPYLPPPTLLQLKIVLLWSPLNKPKNNNNNNSTNKHKRNTSISSLSQLDSTTKNVSFQISLKTIFHNKPKASSTNNMPRSSPTNFMSLSNNNNKSTLWPTPTSFVLGCMADVIYHNPPFQAFSNRLYYTSSYFIHSSSYTPT